MSVFCLKPFNPLPSHEGRQKLSVSSPSLRCLSIHFPLTREDKRSLSSQAMAESFNPLPSHEGRRGSPEADREEMNFQSTSLSRGKTGRGRESFCWGGLSIHFPLTREDKPGHGRISQMMIFQSTSLSRGKTSSGCNRRGWRSLSIHFPLTREDDRGRKPRTGAKSFNPLPSHEGRRSRPQAKNGSEIFQSTSLSRGKTKFLA